MGAALESSVICECSFLSAMPVCTYRGVRYQKATLPKEDNLLKYDRKIYNDRLQDVSTERRMVYRWVKH